VGTVGIPGRGATGDLGYGMGTPESCTPMRPHTVTGGELAAL
jgi:hypothetical protein